MNGFWNTEVTASELLMPELLRETFDQMKVRADWEYQNPHGTEDNPHIVHPKTKERGYGRCVECGAWLGQERRGRSATRISDCFKLQRTGPDP